MTRRRKKLIEVSLPLDAINVASAREKSIRHGHPSTLHLWWARRPLAAARAVIFSQMVDDPSSCPEEFPTEADQDRERRRLFALIEELVLWENTTNEALLERARAEIRRSWRRTCADNADHPQAAELFDPDRLPAFHDPFAGGGSLPLEAQRLGLEAYASDLNPVAVMINKAMIEIPPRFAGKPPVNSDSRAVLALMESEWRGAQGLAQDVRHYGKWMRDEAERRIGHLYPKVAVTAEMAADRPDLTPYVGRKLTVIAWLWARTVKSPNPAFAEVDVPLASTFMLSTKPGKEAYVEPVIEDGSYRFTVKLGRPAEPDAAKAGTKLARGANFRCLMSDGPIAGDYIKSEGQAGRIGARLMAVVAEGDRGRIYLAPTPEHESMARCTRPADVPDQQMPLQDTANFWCTIYGLKTYSDLFTPRQLVALTTFSDLVGEAMERVRRDAVAAGLADDDVPLRDGGTGARAYAEAVATYLAFNVSKAANIGSSVASWMNDRGAFRETFARQAIPMVWDYAEANPLASAGGSMLAAAEKAAMALESLPAGPAGSSRQLDAAQGIGRDCVVISTDPPYYDNIGYADLSDFFYVWLRRSLSLTHPDLFATVGTPKQAELVATPFRHGGQKAAEQFFLAGMTGALAQLASAAREGFPITIYYAFRQSEELKNGGSGNTGWETFLGAVIRARLQVVGTWPMNTEGSGRIRATQSNALATSVVLVCRRSPVDAPTTTRREFVAALRLELPGALRHLQAANIAPVDLAQAAIGPGMAVFTRYSQVLDAQGNPLSVRDALALINQTLDEALAEQEGDFDADTRWALAWFEQYGFAEGEFGVAETLSKAKNTSVDGLAAAGVVESRRGRVRLLKPDELPESWDPSTDVRSNHWEMVHHLVRALNSGGEQAAAELVRKLGSRAETARELAYRLYTLCDRKKRAAEALPYNALVQSWPEIARLAAESPAVAQPVLDLE